MLIPDYNKLPLSEIYVLHGYYGLTAEINDGEAVWIDARKILKEGGN